ELLVEFVASAHGTRHRRVIPYTGPYPSGAPAIFIDQAARLGASAAMIGAVGNDPFGDVLLTRLEQDGVDCRWISRLHDRTTGTAFVAYAEDDTREFVFHLADSAAACFEATPEILAVIAADPPDYLHVSGSSLGVPGMANAVTAIAGKVVESGGSVSFDPNARPELLRSPRVRENFGRLIELTRIFLPSIEDIAILYPGASAATVVERLLLGRMEILVLTRGNGGCEYHDSYRRIELPALPAACTDPTGAGDCFSATFVALHGAGWSAEKALRYANAAGAIAVSKEGPMEGNSSIGEIEKRLRDAP
ncbi:MAG TPA: sugar kinase, partial [Mycobacterium sp.]|nr:sugar kinase [Mycobacterium sp.]